jgi:hypothetical protein
MLEISDLGLTLFQLNEVNEADAALVDAWLEAAGAPEIRSPTGFFLKGLRTGAPPSGEGGERVQLVLRAERWIERVGMLYDQEDAVLGELFDRNGILRDHAEDVQLQRRMLDLWREHRPVGERVERDALERAERNAATYYALRAKPEKKEKT